MEFKEGHSEDMKVPCKLSEREKRFAGVFCGKGLGVLKDAKASNHAGAFRRVTPALPQLNYHCLGWGQCSLKDRQRRIIF